MITGWQCSILLWCCHVFFQSMICFVLFLSASCPPSPQAVVVVKKPGGSETVYDISGDFETVSYVEDEKYALYVFSFSLCYKYVAVASFMFNALIMMFLVVMSNYFHTVDAHVEGFIEAFNAMTLLVGSSDPTKIVPEMMHNVSSGTLNPSLPYLLPATVVRLMCCCRRFVDALGEPQRPCSRCSEVFDSDSELAVHIATHDHEPDFICPVCQQKFTGEMCEPEFVAHVHSHFD